MVNYYKDQVNDIEHVDRKFARNNILNPKNYISYNNNNINRYVNMNVKRL